MPVPPAHLRQDIVLGFFPPHPGAALAAPILTSVPVNPAAAVIIPLETVL